MYGIIGRKLTQEPCSFIIVINIGMNAINGSKIDAEKYDCSLYNKKDLTPANAINKIKGVYIYQEFMLYNEFMLFNHASTILSDNIIKLK